MADTPEDPAPNKAALHPLEEALSRARTKPVEGAVRKLRMQAVMAAVLGSEQGLPTLGPYVVEAKVASGGMGIVFRGRQPESGQPVAIKLLKAEAAAERPRFTREALILRSIVHPYVVRYLDHGLAGGLDYLVMEWLEGRDLASRLARGPLAEADALRLALHVAQALEAAHQAGITHRDVKPSNVFLVADRLEDPRLIDFGIARSVRSSHPGTRLTASGAMLGSPHYMAPEQLRGEHDQRTDVYGLGATLFECLTGRPPFVGAHPAAILLAVMVEPPPRVSALRSDVAPGLDALLQRMLAKDVSDRPRDMAAVTTELLGLLARPAHRSRAPGAVTRAERPLRAGAGTPQPGDDAILVGRVRELAEIEGLRAESAAEEIAALVAVTGDAGSGKSLLLRTLGRPDDEARVVLSASGTGDATGVPFATLRALIATDPEPSASAAVALNALMSELETAHADRDEPAGDPLVFADRMLLAWLELLEAWSARGPLLIVLDDVHRADVTSLRFIDRALSHLRNRCCVVLAAGRNAADLRPLGTSLEPGRKLEIHLGPLRPRAAESLAAALCGEASPQLVADVARLSAGNPAHVVELARQVREGITPGPGSMADLLWSRLDRLAADDRQVLRAASIVGRVVWPGAVAALLGLAPDDPWLATRLAALVAGSYLVAAPRAGGELRLEFTSELIQLAAYDLCTEVDLERGHEVMAHWLVETGAAGPAAIARHMVQAGDRRGALPHFVAAARAALAGDQPTLFDALIDEAQACAAGTQPLLAALTELRAYGAFWRGRIREALDGALAGREGLSEGSEAWLRVTSLAITAAGQLGDNPRVHALASALAALPPSAQASARDARLIGLCRALTQLELWGGVPTTPLWTALADAEASGPEARAWLARSRAVGRGKRSYDEAIAALVATHRAFVEAQDLRAACQIGIYLGSYYTWTGAWERARECIDEALRVAERLGADYLTLWARYTRGKLETEVADSATATATLEAVVAGSASSPRIQAGALIYSAIAGQRAGQHDHAERCARAALALAPAHTVMRAASAALTRALLATGRSATAAALEHDLAPLEGPLGAIVEFDELVMLARAELALAMGGPVQGALPIAQAGACIEARAASLADPLRRNDYLGRPHLIVRTFELARRPTP